MDDIVFKIRDNGNIINKTVLLRVGLNVVHQIRNSCRYVVWIEKNEFISDLKLIYNAPTKEAAKLELDRFDQKWGSKYQLCHLLVES